MKKCTKCGEFKDESEFGKNNKVKSGLRSVCKTCHNLQNKNYRQTEKGKLVQRRHSFKYSHSEKGKKKIKERDKKIIKKYQQKYSHSEKGKLSRKKSRKKYLISEKGKYFSKKNSIKQSKKRVSEIKDYYIAHLQGCSIKIIREYPKRINFLRLKLKLKRELKQLN